VAQQRRESAQPVLDFDTGKLLEYRQLLRDPKHKEIWTKAGAKEFGRLAQGVGGRIDGTNCWKKGERTPSLAPNVRPNLIGLNAACLLIDPCRLARSSEIVLEGVSL